MRKILLLLLAISTLSSAFSQDNTNIAIIPAPVSLIPGQGHFVLPKTTTIGIDAAANQASFSHTIADLQKQLHTATGYNIAPVKPDAAATIRLSLNKKPETALGDEGYDLTVNNTGITIKANKTAGLLYGVQTLLQLLPKEVDSRTPVKGIEWSIPCVAIRDYPRFAWRGLMLDVSRHFFTVQEVKNFIDQMVKYKYNLLHFHLTDDEGWRIEIKSLPRLTMSAVKAALALSPPPPPMNLVITEASIPKTTSKSWSHMLRTSS